MVESTPQVNILVQDLCQMPWVAIRKVLAEPPRGARRAISSRDSATEVAVWTATPLVHPLLTMNENVPVDDS